MTRVRHRLDRAASVEAFKAWLTSCGADILDPTNPYEVVRFRSGAGLSVVYRCERTRYNSMTNQAEAAWSAFKKGQPLDLGPAPVRERPPVLSRALVRYAGRYPLTIARVTRRNRQGIRAALHLLMGLERDGLLIRGGGGPGEALIWTRHPSLSPQAEGSRP